MDFNTARINMVKAQVAPNKIHEPELLDGMMAVARENFVAPNQQDLAYSDVPVGMNDSRRCLKPLQSAQLIRALEVKSGDRVLVVGAGTGFEVAVLRNMGAEVFALESDEGLAQKGQSLTESQQVQWLVGALDQGWSDQAPFDGILFCGAVVAIPTRPIDQLTNEGSLVAIVGKPGDAVMTLTRIKGVSGGGHPEALLETVADHLPGCGPSEQFEL
ncbi:MAG: protein-L-isoaspartate O-methyltransferase [Magnetococcales bacterium]|nr:protein-L-isoaspartate O-methyltransferase [Magnetococcales bacterium]